MKKNVLVLTALCLFVAGATALFGQHSGEVYTRVAWWQVPPLKSAAFEKFFEQYDKPIMDRLLAEGAIVEYGFDAEVLHSADGYTHSTWFASKSLADFEKVDAAYDAANKAMGEEAFKKLDEEFYSMVTKHEDGLFRAHVREVKPSQLDKGYWLATSMRVKAGQGALARETWETHVRPVFEQLLADGTILGFGLDSASIHSETPGQMISWYVLADLGAEEKVDAAFGAAWNKQSDRQKNARRETWEAYSVEGSHRDFMTRLIHYAVK